jgi:hypothetical protein
MGKRPPDEVFFLPSENAISLIARSRGLQPAQTDELCKVIWRSHSEVTWARMSRSERAFDRYRCQELAKDLESAISHLGRGVVHDHLFSDETNEAIGRQTAPAFIDETMKPLKGGFGGMLSAQNASHFFGSHILRAYLEGVRAPIMASLEQVRPDRGGAEPKHARRHLIRALAEASPRVLGKPATPTAGGAFAELVAAAFQACGLSCRGLDQAIRRELGARRSAVP